MSPRTSTTLNGIPNQHPQPNATSQVPQHDPSSCTSPNRTPLFHTSPMLPSTPTRCQSPPAPGVRPQFTSATANATRTRTRATLEVLDTREVGLPSRNSGASLVLSLSHLALSLSHLALSLSH